MAWSPRDSDSLDLRPHVVVLTGAGVSAESGLSTFRDSGGLWEQYDVYDVATPEAWARDPDLVRRFYNERRRQVRAAQPNAAHNAIARLEAQCRVTVITQNVDDLHERAGSSHVVHLHGQILQARSSVDPDEVVDLSDRDITAQDCCSHGYPLRPNVVWFGEPVPAMETAARLVPLADHLLVTGTSLAVYPAASLTEFTEPGTPVTLIDPDPGVTLGSADVIRDRAARGVPAWVDRFLRQGGGL